ncbi:MAG: glycosyltransferase [Pseudomonadota bacterium]
MIDVVPRQQIVIVTPVYEDLDSLQQLIDEVHRIPSLSAHVVVVDDGSVRQPVELESLNTSHANSLTVIQLSRNMGHQRAIAVGLCYVVEKIPETAVVVMDADGEDPPAAIPLLADALSAKDADIVVARRRKRQEGLVFQVFYGIYKLCFLLLTGKSITHGNFMAISPSAARRLASMSELWVHLAATVLASRLRRHEVTVDRGKRYCGMSKMNFISLALHGLRAVTIFVDDVLVRVGTFCSVGAVSCFLAAVTAIFLKIVGFATPGWFSIALGILVILMLQMGFLALSTLLLSGVLRGALVEPPRYGKFVSSIET